MWSGNKGAKAQEKNEMSTLEKSTLDTLHHLAGEEIHLILLSHFYTHKDRPVKHKEIRKFFKGKSIGYVSHYIRSMKKHKLIDNVRSAFNEQELGYKITAQGIKFFKMYKQIEEHVD